jgi:TolB-like protein
VELDAAAIAQHMNEALGSPLFVKAERQARFLRFVVAAALQSPAPLVREFDIARAVYDRREYYELSPPAQVRIDLPKGRYLPQFTFLAAPRRRPRAADTAMLVHPCKALSPAEDDAGFSEGLTEELLHALTRLPRVRVMMPIASDAAQVAGVRPDVRLEATVRRAGDDVRATLRLVDPADGTTIMSNLYATPVTDVFAAQEQLAQRMCADVAAALSAASSEPDKGE